MWLQRNKRLFAVSDITTGMSFDYPELRAHVYFCNPREALQAAIAAVESLPKFRLISADETDCSLIGEAETLIGGFIDDIDIHCLPLARHTRVIVRSRSRQGRGDLGENARHIAALQTAMDKMLVGS